MSNDPAWLLKHRRDVHSLAGEDGVVEKILGLLPGRDRWCVEFGAWDGLFGSNTRHLIEAHGYSAVLIESDRRRYRALRRNCPSGAGVIALNRRVGLAGRERLDRILAATPVPRDFDFLSIDIDGNDYHVWKSLAGFRPKAVAVEFNPTVPTHLRFVQRPDPAVRQGASLLSLVELGREKGYELVSVLSCTAFFVRAEHYPLFRIGDNAPGTLRRDPGEITYLFTGYDGRVFLRGSRRLPWHRLGMREARVQQLPRLLRRYPGDYSLFQRALFVFYLLLSDPGELKSRIRARAAARARPGKRER